MKQILIVEDDSFLNKMLTYNLTADGYGVTSALNARTAADAIRQREFDLVLLDVNLPDGNGFELCRLIKPQHPDTIIIFLTANDQESDQIRGYEVGAVDYITKPFVIGALQRKIKAMFAMLEHHKPAKDLSLIHIFTAKDVMDWHNQMRKLKTKTGKPLSPTYLKTIHGQLSTIFNHAVKYYDLSINPARKAGALGEEEGKEMLFWTKEEYKRFAEEMMDKPLSYYAFQLLYWCGIRSGELLALTPADFNFKKKTLRINKSYQRLKGEDVISTPKTKNSVRTVIMPQFLCDEMQDCLKLYYSLKPDDRIFPVTKYYLNHEMERGCKASGVKKIRVHDLRHSHVSLLINMGYTALAIGKRVGHSAEKITYRYAHLFPSVQQDMAEQLDAENMDEELNEVEGGLANVG